MMSETIQAWRFSSAQSFQNRSAEAFMYIDTEGKSSHKSYSIKILIFR